MWAESLPWYSDIRTAVLSCLSGSFYLARSPSGPNQDEDPARQTTAKPVTSSASVHRHTQKNTHTHTYWESSWHSGMLFISFWDNVILSRPRPLSRSLSLSFYLSSCPVCSLVLCAWICLALCKQSQNQKSKKQHDEKLTIIRFSNCELARGG